MLQRFPFARLIVLALFVAKPGRGIGAKVGLFALGTVRVWEYGCSDVDWFRVAAN